MNRIAQVAISEGVSAFVHRRSNIFTMQGLTKARSRR